MTGRTAARATPIDQAPSAPEASPRIVIRKEAGRRLKSEADRGMSMLPGRRAEVGGILLGAVQAEGGERTVVIEQVEPFACSYSAGPHWKLSAGEGALLALRLRDARAAQRPIIGLYRSHTRETPGLSADDIGLYESCFSDPEDVFVLVHAGPGGAAYGELWYRDGAGIQRSRTPCPIVAEAVVPVAEHAAPAPSVAPQDQPAVESRPRISNGILAVLVLSAALVIAAAVAGMVAYQRLRPAAGLSPLALQVEKRSDHLLLKWDASAAPVRSARRGRLTILDGGYQRNVVLSADQVHAGRLYYLPGGGDLEFRLELEEDNGRRVGESIDLISNSSGHAPVDLVEARKPAPPRPAGDSVASRPAVVSAGDRPAPAPERSRPQFRPPPEDAQAAVVAAPAVLGAPPVVATGAAGVPAAFPQTALQPPPVAAPKPRPPAPARVEPQSPPPAVPNVTPPQPVHQVSPVLPERVRVLMHGPIEIQVKVAINEQGKVTHATVVQEKGAVAGYLTDAALAAARQWSFTPARANGHPLPSEKVLVFTVAAPR